MLRVKPDLAAELREAREAAMLTQEELADRLGVSARTLQGWEAGRLPQPKNRRVVERFLAQHRRRQEAA